VPHKLLSSLQNYDVDSLNVVAEECGDEDTIYYASHNQRFVGMRLQCDINDVGWLSGIA
jgi:hypothetical protein